MQHGLLDDFLNCKNQKGREAFLLKYHHGYSCARYSPTGAFVIFSHKFKGKVTCGHIEALRRLERYLKDDQKERVFHQIPGIEKGLQDSQCFREAQKYVKSFVVLFEKGNYPALVEKLNRSLSPCIALKLYAEDSYIFPSTSYSVALFSGEEIIVQCLLEIWKKLPTVVPQLPIWKSENDIWREVKRLRKVTGIKAPVGNRFPITGPKDPRKHEKALAFLAKGVGIRETACRVGYNPSTVSRLRKRADKACVLLEEGKSIKEVAREIGLSISMITLWKEYQKTQPAERCTIHRKDPKI